MTTAIRSAAKIVSRFARERDGSIAMMTGVVFTALVMAAGGVTDITRAQVIQSKAQKTLDAAVLSMVRSTMTDDEIARRGPEVFASWIGNNGIDGEISSSDFVSRSTGNAPGQPDELTGTATLRTKTYFLGLFGRETLDITVSSTALKPDPLPYEISLVLDVSGSMNEMLNGRPRIERMKDATLAMIDEIERQSRGREAPTISLVPYSTSVNIGDLGNGVLEGASVGGAASPLSGMDVWAAERFRGDDGLRYDLSDEGPASAPIPFVTGAEISHASPAVRLQGPSTSSSVYRQAITGMRADGWTSAHTGMIWGVYALSPGWSSVWATDPRPYGSAKKVIVMLTDGEFNTTHAIGARSTTDGSESNRYFQSACDLAKNRDIAIYTVALGLDATGEARLRACVDGGEGRMFSAGSADELTEVFKEIAREIGGLRLSS